MALYNIRAELNHIHGTLNHPALKEMLPCICAECRDAQAPYMFEFEKLLKYQKKGRANMPCMESAEDVTIAELLDGISYQVPQDDNLVMENSKVFISYSSNSTDKKHLERLKVHLSPFERKGLAYFDATGIKAGEDWRARINSALSSARVAVLLVSGDFMASDFIQDIELPALLGKAGAKGTKVLWVLLSPANIPENIGRFQAVHKTDKPLSKMNRHEREEVWAKLAVLVEQAVNKKQ